MDYRKKLTTAVSRQMGITDKSEFAEAMANVKAGGATDGHRGFIWHAETAAFFRRNRATILVALEQDAADMGEDVIQMVRHFHCLTERGNRRPLYSESAIGRVLFGQWRWDDAEVQIANALAWYALEAVADWTEDV